MPDNLRHMGIRSQRAYNSDSGFLCLPFLPLHPDFSLVLGVFPRRRHPSPAPSTPLNRSVFPNPHLNSWTSRPLNSGRHFRTRTVFTGWAKMAFEPGGKEAESLVFRLLPAYREALRPLQGKKMIPEAEEARPLPKRRLPVPAGMGKPLSSRR